MQYLRQFLRRSRCDCCICIKRWVEKAHATYEAISACGSVRNVECNFGVCANGANHTDAESVTTTNSDAGAHEHADAVTELYTYSDAFGAYTDAGADPMAHAYAVVH